MPEYEYTFGITGVLTARQKMMAMKLLRESKTTVLAIDSMNAKRANALQIVAKLVVFWPSMKMADFEGSLSPIDWPLERVLLEGEDFPFGMIPEEENK